MIPSQKTSHIVSHWASEGASQGAVSTFDAVFDRILVPASVSRADEVLQADMAALASRTGATITVTPPTVDEGWTGMVLRQEECIGADLIGIPAPKRGLWQSLFLDPDVRTVCSLSPVPVWVSGDAPVLQGAPRIICAVDLQEGSDAVLYFANRLATAISTGITIVYALPEVTDGTLAASLLDPEVVMAPEVAEDRLKVLADHCTTPVETRLLHGISGPEVNRFATEWQAPAIILTGRKKRARLGATVAHLLRRSSCPIVIAPIS